MNRITVLGASGFIGSELVKKLQETHVDHFAPGRDEKLPSRQLGHIIYCIGLTADFRTRAFETVEAHVGELLRVLRDCEFDSLLYLSSTRLYRSAPAPAREEDPILVSPLNQEDLFNISKVMGESLSLACGKKTRVARLSNVYGLDFASQNFLSTILTDAILKGSVTVQTAPDAEKDYVSVQDVVDGLIKIALTGKQSIYNLASGINVSTYQLTKKISELTHCRIVFDPTAARISFPPINVDRMRSEFGYRPANVLDDLDELIVRYRKHYEERNGQSQLLQPG
jgi:nucleoside-diphosphate-sugar epimerase